MRLIQRLTPNEKAEILDLLESEVHPRLVREERRSYAEGRLQAWLAWQPEYGEVPRAERRPRGALWDVLKRYVSGFELAECYLNSTDRGRSSRGIRPHKDHTYAAPTAWLINLGPTRFRIWLPHAERPDGLRFVAVKENRTNVEFGVDLEGDEVIEFNSKMMHASRTEADARWGIGLWTFNPTWKMAAGISD